MEKSVWNFFPVLNEGVSKWKNLSHFYKFSSQFLKYQLGNSYVLLGFILDDLSYLGL